MPFCRKTKSISEGKPSASEVSTSTDVFQKKLHKIKNIQIQKIMTINRYFPVIRPEKNNQLWEALKFLFILLLILLIATPQLVLAVLLLILMGAIMEMIRILSLSTSLGRRLGWQK